VRLTARINPEIAPAEFHWITALLAPAIRVLAEGRALQISLFESVT
jgi:hypothetical protein